KAISFGFLPRLFHRLQSPLGSLTSQGSQSESRSETSQSNGRKAALTKQQVFLAIIPRFAHRRPQCR
ncbi:hypothetical protein, partial [Bradyrhizobium diazoefficiens]|uniref:hypothetical protein n=1 Tax=Bradyrhizobium diazoefficiens TaxID=1355477 RepID=UPI001B8C5EBC